MKNRNAFHAGLAAMLASGALVDSRTGLPRIDGPQPWYPTRSTYDPNRFRDDKQRMADAALKRERRMERNRDLLSTGAVQGVRS